jgi:type IV pilus assembly protein PilW
MLNLRRPARQRGLTLVELMVGLAVGMFVVAGAMVLMGSQLGDNRRLMLETQVQQDLRAAADMVVRDLRRAGHWTNAQNGVPGALPAASNPYAAVSPGNDGEQASAVVFTYAHDLADGGPGVSSNQGGFRLNGSALEMLMGGAGWQAMTDVNTLQVTGFQLQVNRQDLLLPCAQACAVGATDCPPRQQVRDLTVVLSGRATHDANVQRTVRSNVRLRNDSVVGACPA